MAVFLLEVAEAESWKHVACNAPIRRQGEEILHFFFFKVISTPHGGSNSRSRDQESHLCSPGWTSPMPPKYWNLQSSLQSLIACVLERNSLASRRLESIRIPQLHPGCAQRWRPEGCEGLSRRWHWLGKPATNSCSLSTFSAGEFSGTDGGSPVAGVRNNSWHHNQPAFIACMCSVSCQKRGILPFEIRFCLFFGVFWPFECLVTSRAGNCCF